MNRPIRRRPVDLSKCELSDLPPLLQRIYAARGIRGRVDLDHSLSGLPDPQGLLGIDTACDLLEHALVNDLRILIVGDYDADGATSTALVLSALKAMGARQVDFMVPDRFTMGYGTESGAGRQGG